jgi:hypothetical protein
VTAADRVSCRLKSRSVRVSCSTFQVETALWVVGQVESCDRQAGAGADDLQQSVQPFLVLLVLGQAAEERGPVE